MSPRPPVKIALVVVSWEREGPPVRVPAVWKAKWVALLGIPEVPRKRRSVQRRRCIGLRDLRDAMAHGWSTRYSEVARAGDVSAIEVAR